MQHKNKVTMMSVRYNNKSMCDYGYHFEWYYLYPYIEKGLQLFPDMEITRDIVELADNIRYELFKNDQLATLKELCFSKIYQFNLNVRLLPKWLWEQFTEKYVFEKVSWNYLELAIPKFLSKHSGGTLVYNKKPYTLFPVKEIFVRNSNNGQWERHNFPI